MWGPPSMREKIGLNLTWPSTIGKDSLSVLWIKSDKNGTGENYAEIWKLRPWQGNCQCSSSSIKYPSKDLVERLLHFFPRLARIKLFLNLKSLNGLGRCKIWLREKRGALKSTEGLEPKLKWTIFTFWPWVMRGDACCPTKGKIVIPLFWAWVTKNTEGGEIINALISGISTIRFWYNRV